MIKLRLSDTVKRMGAKQNPVSKCKIDVNSPEFYKNHPDLTPRNVYLELGRVISKKQIEKDLNAICKLSFKDKCQIVFNRLKNLVTGKNN